MDLFVSQSVFIFQIGFQGILAVGFGGQSPLPYSRGNHQRLLSRLYDHPSTSGYLGERHQRTVPGNVRLFIVAADLNVPLEALPPPLFVEPVTGRINDFCRMNHIFAVAGQVAENPVHQAACLARENHDPVIAKGGKVTNRLRQRPPMLKGTKTQAG